MTDFLTEAHKLFDYTRTLRRDFHVHPELAFNEIRTAGIVARELQSLGLEVTTGVGKTGVVALLEGAKPGPVVMLRFDMDALPITEETGAEYASQNPGVMHACGHDGHTAVGLTVARMLHAVREHLPGTVKFVFQPAEEGQGGAPSMIADGVLENPHVESVLALHLWNEKPLGWLGIAPGPAMAGAEFFDIRVTGKGGHGAVPEATVDPVLAGSQIVTGLQSIVARNVSPLDTAVVSVTTFQGGDAFNVIPQSIRLSGTIRTFTPAVREKVLQRFFEIVNGIAAAMGCTAEIEHKRRTPALVNQPRATEVVRRAAQRILPDHALDAGAPVTMGAEDFAFFLEQVPGCFFFVGSANRERGLNYGHHHPKFDFDEAALPQAAALMAQAALEALADPGQS